MLRWALATQREKDTGHTCIIDQMLWCLHFYIKILIRKSFLLMLFDRQRTILPEPCYSFQWPCLEPQHGTPIWQELPLPSCRRNHSWKPWVCMRDSIKDRLLLVSSFSLSGGRELTSLNSQNTLPLREVLVPFLQMAKLRLSGFPRVTHPANGRAKSHIQDCLFHNPVFFPWNYSIFQRTISDIRL